MLAVGFLASLGAVDPLDPWTERLRDPGRQPGDVRPERLSYLMGQPSHEGSRLSKMPTDRDGDHYPPDCDSDTRSSVARQA